MTFQEARDRLLGQWDTRVAELRKILADPLLCNGCYKPLKEALEDLDILKKRILHLNEVEQEFLS